MSALSFNTQKALLLLSQMIKTARQSRRMSQQALAERLGVTRQTVMAMEKANPMVSVGTWFEAAAILGIPLLSDHPERLNQWQAVLAGFNALLPKHIHDKKVEVDDDF